MPDATALIEDLPLSGSTTNAAIEATQGGSAVKVPLTLTTIRAESWIIRRDLASPPANPAEGDRYLVASSATGDWMGLDGRIVQWVLNGSGTGSWYNKLPGGILYDLHADQAIYYNGTGWFDISALFSVNFDAAGAAAAVLATSAQKSQNLADLSDKPAALANLGGAKGDDLINVRDSTLFAKGPVDLISNTPDASPTVGMRRLIGSSPTGIWSAKSNQVAEYFADGWHYSGSAKVGQAIYIIADDQGRHFTGSEFIIDPSSVIAVGSIADAEASQFATSVVALKIGGYNFAYSASDPGTHDAFVQDLNGRYYVLSDMSVGFEAMGAVGDGSTDDHTAISVILGYCEATGAKLRPQGKTYKTTQKITIDFSVDLACVDGGWFEILKGVTGDVLEITAPPLNLHRVRVDGNAPGGGDRTADQEVGCLFSIHGPVGLGFGYITGGVVGDIAAKNGRTTSAILLHNLDLFTFEGAINATGCWGQGVLWSGVSRTNVRHVFADDIGNLAALGVRIGAGCAVFNLDADTGAKQPAVWFATASTKPCVQLTFENVIARRTTETSIYVHDLGGVNCTGVDQVTFLSFSISLSGHAGLKVRLGATNVRVGMAIIDRVADAGVAVDNALTSDIFVNAVVTNVGYDAIGEMTGTAAPWTGGANNGKGQSLNATPRGVLVDNGGDASGPINVNIVARVKGVRATPSATTYGYGLHVQGTTKLWVMGTFQDTDGLGARLDNWVGGGGTLTLIDCSRTAAASADEFLYSTNDSAYSTDLILDVTCIETSGTKVCDLAVRFNGGTNINLRVRANYAHFKMAAWSCLSKWASGMVTSYHHPMTVETLIGTLTSDGSGNVTLAHGLPTTPRVILQKTSADSNRLEARVTDSTNIKGVLYTGATTTAAASTSVGVIAQVIGQNLNGFF